MQEEQNINQNYELPPNFVDDTKIPIDVKEKAIKRKRFLFSTIFAIAGIVIIFGGIGLVTIIKNIQEQRRRPVVIIGGNASGSQPGASGSNPTPSLGPATINQYASDNLKVRLEYSSAAKIVDSPELDNQPRKLEVLYVKDSSDKESWTADNITSGYIYRVSNFKLESRDLDDIAEIKKESFMLKCPSTSTFTQITKDVINFEDARTFRIANCDGDYIFSYAQKFGLTYEIVQIFKGDVGYRQLYESTTGDIARSFKFYPDDDGPTGPSVTYVSKNYRFSFEHPLLNETCCSVPEPVNDFQKIVSLGDASTYKSDTEFDGIGFFVKKGNFAQQVESQKKTLIEDYIVAKGSAPLTEETKYTVQGKEAIKLKGFSWKGNDIVLIKAQTDGHTDTVLAISILNVSGAPFDNAVDLIFKSLEFF